MRYITCVAQGGCSVQDVVKATGISRNPCRRVLEYLRLEGLVQRQSAGRTFIYSAIHNSPAVAHFKIFETIRSLQPLVKRLRTQTHRIVLYGPCAEGADTAASDINLFIVAPNSTAVLNITEPYPVAGRKVAAIIMPPGDEIPILTEDPETTIQQIEAGLLLWQDPAKPLPHLVTRGGGRNKIAIVTDYLKWKKSADPHWASEPYVISMAFDSHTAKGETIEPFFNALPFPNVLVGDTVPMAGEGHFLYGPRDPGGFVAISVFWMEKDAGARDLGQTLSDLQANKKIKSSLKAIASLAGEGVGKLLPGLGAVTTIVAEALKLNKDDEIFRTDGVYVKTTKPPYRIGSEKVLGNVFMDFNLKVIDMGD